MAMKMQWEVKISFWYRCEVEETARAHLTLVTLSLYIPQHQQQQQQQHASHSKISAQPLLFYVDIATTQQLFQ
jgi:hypothetical protein